MKFREISLHGSVETKYPSQHAFTYQRQDIVYLFTCLNTTSQAHAEQMISSYFSLVYDGTFLINLYHYQTKIYKQKLLASIGFKVSNKKISELDEMIQQLITGELQCN